MSQRLFGFFSLKLQSIRINLVFQCSRAVRGNVFLFEEVRHVRGNFIAPREEVSVRFIVDEAA